MKTWTDEELEKEFELLRVKIKKIAEDIHSGDTASAVFMLGCLHSIFHYHAERCQENILSSKRLDDIQSILRH